MASSAATVAAAMVARARREVREHFEKHDAFDPGHAVTYDPPDRMHQRQFELLIGRGILRETGDGRYWIDREAVRLEDERRKAALKVVLLLLLVGLAVGVAIAAIANA
ncbi:MAG TPA: hypothetical protein VFW39_11785 [Sphingomicrobium sp.]|nr:hypothetical protein [Sphingomicrobium sp.]